MRRVCIHMQDVMYKQPRGIPQAVFGLTKALLRRNNNMYGLSYFDYNKERNNRLFLEDGLGNIITNASLFECNSKSYKDVIEGLRTRNDSLYNKYSYEEYIGFTPDVIYFPNVYNMPHNIITEKVITTIHDTLPVLKDFKQQFSESEQARFKHSLEYLNLNSNVIVTVDSLATKMDVLDCSSIEEERIIVLPMGYDKTKIYNEIDNKVLDKFEIKKSYILYLGAVDARKGIDLFDGIIELLEKKDFQLVLSGKIESNVDDGIVEELKKNKNVIFTNYVTDDEKRILMSMAEIFVFPSYYEGFGLPVIEAMACGTPVITADNSSLPEVGGDAAIYFETGNVESLREKINTLMESNELKKKCIDKGFEQVKRFSWEESAKKMEKIFDKIT